jgi:hypothetical protein
MDRGKHSKKSERLPIISRAFNVTHVMLSPGLEKRSMHFRVVAIEACWPDLVAVGSAPAGTGDVLAMHEIEGGVSFHLRKKTDSLPPEDAPLVQQDLRSQWDSE